MLMIIYYEDDHLMISTWGCAYSFGRINSREAVWDSSAGVGSRAGARSGLGSSRTQMKIGGLRRASNRSARADAQGSLGGDSFPFHQYGAKIVGNDAIPVVSIQVSVPG